MEEFYDKMVNFIKQENEKIRQEIIEVKEEIAEVRQELQQEILAVRQEIDQTKQEFRKKMIIFEDHYGRKIDATYEFVNLQNELLKEKFEDIRRLDKRVQRNEIEIFDHENRICNLEKIKC